MEKLGEEEENQANQKKAIKLYKKLKDYEKIFNKLSNNHKVKEKYGIPDNESENATKQRIQTFKILPWIAFNFNIFILILILICIIIIIKRINLKSDFNYLKAENNHSVQKKILGKHGFESFNNIDSADNGTSSKRKKKKKKKKKKSSKFRCDTIKIKKKRGIKTEKY